MRVFSALCAVLSFGCSSGPGPNDAGSDAGPGDVVTDTPQEAGCPQGSVVPQFITSSYTLSKACSPWHVEQPVLVGSSSAPVLTVEAGVTVLFSAGTYLYVGQDQTGSSVPAKLTAVGTSTDAINFEYDGVAKAGSWGSIYFGPAADSTSAIEYALVESAGAQFPPLLDVPTDLGSIIVDSGSLRSNADAGGAPLRVTLSNLTLRDNGGSGIVFFGSLAGFSASSSRILVADWASGGYPIVIDGNSAETIPSSITTGSGGKDGSIGIIPEEANVNGGAQDFIDHSQTWPSLPIPYTIESYGYPNTGNCGLLVVGGSSTTTLTIAAPNTLRFMTPCGISVDDDSTGRGFLAANGTSSSSITFTSAQQSPAVGDWAGIEFNTSTTGQAASSLSYCTISYAQQPDGLNPASAVLVHLYPNPGMGPSITNCTFTEYAGTSCPNTCCGILASETSNAASYGTQATGANGNTFSPGGTGFDVCTSTSN